MRALFTFCVAALTAVAAHAMPLNGVVRIAALPMPGATVTVVHDGKPISTTTDDAGAFSFPNLDKGAWTLTITMLGFEPLAKEIEIIDIVAPPLEFDLKMLPLDQIKAAVQTISAAAPPAEPEPTAKPAAKADAGNEAEQARRVELAQKASDSVLVNGSAIHADASPFGQVSAFGNNRNAGKSLYNYSLGLIFDNSSLDARTYSLTGQDTPKPNYNRMQGLLGFGGPLKIPHLIRKGPSITATYQWTRNNDVTTVSSRVPTQAERSGILSQPVLDPLTNAPFANNVVPVNRISPQATALLNLYPLPNFASALYNYQAALQNATHDDSLQIRAQQRVNRKNQIFGNFALTSTRTSNTNLFNFLDNNHVLGVNTGVNWLHNFSSRWYATFGFTFSRLSTQTDPYFENRRNVSGEAGITGNNQQAAYWGPPNLQFSSGIASLNDVDFARNHNQTSGVTAEANWSRSKHQVTFGGAFRKQQWNNLYQEDPRGQFSFTGSAAGNDLGAFLLGVPDTSAVAFGNADKYFRSTLATAYVSDDWRARPNLTLTTGMRWEYQGPINERYGRLVNLNISNNFQSAVPVTDVSTGRPDRNNFSPRFGFAYRPSAASSLIIRGGYGIYYDTSVYLWIATQMAQQSPLSKSLRTQNSPLNPLTLANGFYGTAISTPNTFAVDPNFRIGYAQNFNLFVQRDLPKSLVLVASYLGIKGTRAQQQVLPNTVPPGGSPCVGCPVGFSYLTSNGNSIRNAGDIEIRRRLSSGLGATVHYTLSKSIDNAALGGRNQGGPLIAQNWLDLSSERALSNFDQRHLLTVTTQYTSGMGLHGGTLLSGWRGALAKEWTLTTRITAGSGFPLTPIYFAVVPGTGITSSVRPDYDGLPIGLAPPGVHINRAAYVAPLPGHWGNAGRDTITGPRQITANASMGRTFRAGDRGNLDVRFDATNFLNHPNFTAWNTVINSNQFGLPQQAVAMRRVQVNIRLRF